MKGELVISPTYGLWPSEDLQLRTLEKYRNWLLNRASRLAAKNNRVDLDDLLQVGRMALLDALRRHDGRRGFIAYAELVVRSAMLEHVRTFQAPVRMPTDVFRKNSFRRLSALPVAVPLDAPVNPDSETTWAEMLPAPEPEPQLSAMPDLLGRVNRALAQLSERERFALFGLYICRMTFREVAEHDGVSIQAVWKAEQRALAKLRKNPLLKNC